MGLAHLENGRQQVPIGVTALEVGVADAIGARCGVGSPLELGDDFLP